MLYGHIIVVVPLLQVDNHKNAAVQTEHCTCVNREHYLCEQGQATSCMYVHNCDTVAGMVETGVPHTVAKIAIGDC